MGRSSKAGTDDRRATSLTCCAPETEVSPPDFRLLANSNTEVVAPSGVSAPHTPKFYTAVNAVTGAARLIAPEVARLSVGDAAAPRAGHFSNAGEAVTTVTPSGQAMSNQAAIMSQDGNMREQVPPLNYPHGLLAAIFSYMIHFNKQAPPPYEGAGPCGVTFEEVVAGIRDQYPEDVKALEQGREPWMTEIQELLSDEKWFLHACDRFAIGGLKGTAGNGDMPPRIFYSFKLGILNEAMAIKRRAGADPEFCLDRQGASVLEPAAQTAPTSPVRGHRRRPARRSVDVSGATDREMIFAAAPEELAQPQADVPASKIRTSARGKRKGKQSESTTSAPVAEKRRPTAKSAGKKTAGRADIVSEEVLRTTTPSDLPGGPTAVRILPADPVVPADCGRSFSETPTTIAAQLLPMEGAPAAPDAEPTETPHGRTLHQELAAAAILKDLAAAREALAFMRFERDDALGNFHRVRAEAEKLLAERNGARDSASTLRAECDEARTNVTRLHAERDELRSKLGEAAMESENAREEAERVRAEKTATVDILNKTLSEARRSVAELEKAAVDAAKAHELLQVEKDKIVEALSKVNAERDAMISEAEAIRAETIFAIAERSAAVADAKQAGLQRDEAVEKSVKAREAMERATAMMEKAVADAEKARVDANQARGFMDQLQRELNAARDELDCVRAERDEALREKEVFMDERDAAREEVARVRAAAALETDRLGGALRAELNDARAERDRHLTAARNFAGREQFLTAWAVANQSKIHEVAAAMREAWLAVCEFGTKRKKRTKSQNGVEMFDEGLEEVSKWMRAFWLLAGVCSPNSTCSEARDARADVAKDVDTDDTSSRKPQSMSTTARRSRSQASTPADETATPAPSRSRPHRALPLADAASLPARTRSAKSAGGQ